MVSVLPTAADEGKAKRSAISTRCDAPETESTMKRGRKPKSGFKSSIDSQKEFDSDIYSKLRHGYKEDIARLRQLVEDERKHQVAEHKALLQRERNSAIDDFQRKLPQERERYRHQHEATLNGYDAALKQAEENPWPLAENFLSSRAAQINERAAKRRYVELHELDTLWRKVAAQFERAIVNGDADWFERQWKVLSRPSEQADQFEAAVVYWLRQAVWSYRARQGEPGEREESEHIPLFGKPTDWTSADIYAQLHVEKLPRGELRVEGRVFKPRSGKTSKNVARERVVGAIQEVAERYGVTLRKHPGARSSTDSKSADTR